MQDVTESKHRPRCRFHVTIVDVRRLAINVVRMVKLFGWEPRVLEQLSKKREVELRYQWKYKVLGLSNAILKCVASESLRWYLTTDLCSRIIPFVTMIATFFTYVSV